MTNLNTLVTFKVDFAQSRNTRSYSVDQVHRRFVLTLHFATTRRKSKHCISVTKWFSKYKKKASFSGKNGQNDSFDQRKLAFDKTCDMKKSQKMVSGYLQVIKKNCRSRHERGPIKCAFTRSSKPK